MAVGPRQQTVATEMALAVRVVGDGMAYEAARRWQRDTRKGMARLAGAVAVRVRRIGQGRRSDWERAVEGERVRKLGVLAAIPRARGRESSAGAHGRNGAARSLAWRTCGHSVEHVAGDGVGVAGTKFGPAMC